MKKILAIDDQQDNLTTIEAVIKHNLPNCMVLTALSGKEGIKIAKKEQPDTILLDIIMPGMDGFETCTKLKEDESTKYIPVILVTAIKTDSESRVKGLNLGADAFVAKPIDPIELSAQVNVMLRIKVAEDKLRGEKEVLKETVTEKTGELKVSDERYRSMFENMLGGFAYHKIVTDKTGIPIDYTFLEANDGFEELTGLKGKNLIDKNVTEVIPGIENDSTDWIGKYGEVALSGKEIRFESYSEALNRWYSIYAYSPRKGYFATFFEDITERKQAEEALKENEERLKILFESAPDAYYIHDFKGIFLDLNKEAEKILGYKKEELIGRSFLNLQLLMGKEMLRATQVLMNNVKGSSTSPEEFIINRKDGSKVHVEISTHPVKIKDKRVILGIARDITERKRTEEEMNKLVAIVKNSSELVNLSTLDGKMIFLNESGSKILGIEPEEVENVNIMEVIPDHLKVMAENEIVPTLLKGENWGGYLQYLNLKTGKITDVHATTFPIKDPKTEEPLFLANVSYDISEHKRADQIQKVLYNISHAVNTTDSLEKLIYQIKEELSTIINTTNFYVALYDKTSDTLSFPYYVDEKDNFTTAPAGSTLSKYVIETKRPLLANLALKRKFVKEGKLIHIGSLSKVWLGVPLKIGNKVTGVFAVQSYIDENAFNESDKRMLEFVSDQISLSIHRKKAEEELKAALKKAEESDRLKSAFLANMSHEIRTPMNGILGFASLLHTPDLTGEQLNKYANIIEKSGDRLLNIINDLLDISKIEAGQMELSLSDCNVNEQIEFLHTFFKPEAYNAGLEIYFKYGLPSEKADVETDREKLYAILTNLIKNAIKYTHEGSINFGYEKKGKKLEFYVKDTGIGVHKERQKAIFERFVQADIEDIKAYEGAGLGLSITKAYVDMLGGEIWVDSFEGEGSSFYFTLPYRETKEVIKLPGEDIPQPGILSKKIKVLISEDDKLADDFLTIITKAFSSTLLHATNGKEAIDLCRQNPDIDLILMDIKMPVMDGLEATRKIREFNKDVIIIAQTAFALAGDYEKAIEAGCNDYITKPIDKNKLMKMISEHIK